MSLFRSSPSLSWTISRVARLSSSRSRSAMLPLHTSSSTAVSLLPLSSRSFAIKSGLAPTSFEQPFPSPILTSSHYSLHYQPTSIFLYRYPPTVFEDEFDNYQLNNIPRGTINFSESSQAFLHFPSVISQRDLQMRLNLPTTAQTTTTGLPPIEESTAAGSTTVASKPLYALSVQTSSKLRRLLAADEATRNMAAADKDLKTYLCKIIFTAPVHLQTTESNETASQVTQTPTTSFSNQEYQFIIPSLFVFAEEDSLAAFISHLKCSIAMSYLPPEYFQTNNLQSIPASLLPNIIIKTKDPRGNSTQVENAEKCSQLVDTRGVLVEVSFPPTVLNSYPSLPSTSFSIPINGGLPVERAEPSLLRQYRIFIVVLCLVAGIFGHDIYSRYQEMLEHSKKVQIDRKKLEYELMKDKAK